MDVRVVGNLKDKYIKDFNKFRQQLYKGIVSDYSLLMYEVAVIEDSDYFGNNIYEYLMSL